MDVFFVEKIIDGVDDDVWVDVFKALAKNIDFLLANGRLQSVYLAVGVGDANIIHVHQGDRAHTTSGQCFSGPSPHAADAYDGKGSIVVGVTADLVERFSAVELVRIGVAELGGKGGGGRPDMAQGGGPEAGRTDAALAAIERVRGAG